MTALPATRQEAMRLIERLDDDKASYDALNVDIIVAESVEMNQLLALARRGAETVGATERWIADEDSATGETYLFERPDKNPTAYPMRRCLILPPEE